MADRAVPSSLKIFCGVTYTEWSDSKDRNNMKCCKYRINESVWSMNVYKFTHLSEATTLILVGNNRIIYKIENSNKRR
jgi:hypothetical protein